METAPATSSRPAPIHLNGVDGLRGCAALLIVVYHMFCTCNAPTLRVHGINLFRGLEDGWCGVNLFLVLSGFCLFWPYARDPARRLNYLDFMRRRARRIIPAYYASLLLFPILFQVIWSILKITGRSAWPSGWLDVLLHLTLLQTLNARTYWTWNGLSWSLGLEWLWYLLFPLPVWLFRRFGPAIAVLTMGLITLAYATSARIVAGPASDIPTQTLAPLENFVLNRLFEFGLGMLAAWWLANRPIPPRMIGTMIFLLPFVLLLAHRPPNFDALFPVRNALYGIAFAMLVLITVAPGGNFLRRSFSSPVFRYVGDSSYSLYLLHLPFVALISTALLRTVRSESAAFFLSLPFVPVIVLITRPSYLLFEKPFLAPLKSPPRPIAPAAVATT